MATLVSVIVLTYHHADFIADCLEGIRNQKSRFDLEIIVCDDASTDGTSDEIRRIAGEDARIRPFIHAKNLGAAKNFEFALAQCRGEFVAYCEGDDVWISDEKIAKQAEALMRFEDTDLVYSSYGRMNEKGNIIEAEVPFDGGETFPLEALIDGHGPSMNSIVLRKAVFSHKFPKAFYTVPNPDVFILAAALRKKPGRFVPGVFSMYRIHGGGIWSGRAQLEKNLIRYATLAEVFSWPAVAKPKFMGRIYGRLEAALITAKRKDRKLYGRYWKKLPWGRRAKLKAKWLYAGFFAK